MTHAAGDTPQDGATGTRQDTRRVSPADARRDALQVSPQDGSEPQEATEPGCAAIGWHALAGSLDDPGLTPLRADEFERPDRVWRTADTARLADAAVDALDVCGSANRSRPAAAAPGGLSVAADERPVAAADAVGSAAVPAGATLADGPASSAAGLPSGHPLPVRPYPPSNDDSVPPHPRPRQCSRAVTTLIAALLTGALLVVVGTTATLDDKAVVAPGLTADIEEFVAVSGHPVYASEASISLVSVRTSFAPSLFEFVGAWLDGATDVIDVEDILGDRTIEQNRDAGRRQMDQSTQVAVAVALEHLGYEVMTPIGARVVGVMPDSPAEGVLREGDMVQAVDGTAITTAQSLSETIKTSEPGATVALTALDPEGQTRTITVALADSEGVALLGVVVATHVEFEELPIDVTLHVDSIGGPSAGLAFTLSVIDALTPEPLTGNLDVAATGTIRHDGTVGPVGGVTQKSHAAVRAGTDLFLVPASQVDEALAVADPSVAVVGVESLQEALDAIANHRS